MSNETKRLNVGAIAARARRVYPKGAWDGDEAERARVVVVEDVPALVAEVRRLRDAAREYLDAQDALSAARDSLPAGADDATWARVNTEIGAADIRRDAARTRLAALVVTP